MGSKRYPFDIRTSRSKHGPRWRYVDRRAAGRDELQARREDAVMMPELLRRVAEIEAHPERCVSFEELMKETNDAK